ncbi:MAG: hypothetical protein ACI4DY_01855, partial [Monoglobaceae bacterium]
CEYDEHQASAASGDEGAGQLFNKIISDFMMLSTYFGFLILQLSNFFDLTYKPILSHNIIDFNQNILIEIITILIFRKVYDII